ncbi:hypothetical protein K1T71_003061 [Dendrolimus kikuchii]|uniref:Uncharacterized protein n=1 Tax=Dendrolimus kikuchii TaxID=765133 RepID=A0ACC1DBF4_9NEOP|nr:hypothetical protein K1T71_003061 [Dendrolimus kikuchii]
MVGISKSHNYQTIVKQHDYLSKSDLLVLLQSLEKIIKFITFNNISLSLNFVFGIFLVSVNLERVLIVDNHDLGFFMRQYMTHLLETNNRNLNVFMEHIEKFINERDMKIFAGLNPNAFDWASRIYTFKIPSRREYVNLKKEQTIPNKTSKGVLSVPSPKMSDKCLASFSQSPVDYTEELTQCKVAGICYYVIRNGTNAEYALTHRLLPLLIAQIGRNCNIFSPEEDSQRVNKFCSDIYKEAHRITENNFSNMDLLLEQITLCSLNGDALFFHRRWFAEILQYQTTEGCFSYYSINTKTRKANEELVNKKSTKYSACGEHITSVAAGALSAAIRFIIERFY